MNFKVERSEILFKGKVFDLQVDNIIYNSGNTGVREVAVHPGGAVVVPVKDNGRFIMVSQFRYPFKKTILEFPAGKLDEGEDPFKCAGRELEEETGYKASDISELGKIYSTPGFCTEILHLYLARNLVNGSPRREEGEEGMEIFEFTADEIEDKIKHGEINDAKTICAFHLSKNYL